MKVVDIEIGEAYAVKDRSGTISRATVTDKTRKVESGLWAVTVQEFDSRWSRPRDVRPADIVRTWADHEARIAWVQENEARLAAVEAEQQERVRKAAADLEELAGMAVVPSGHPVRYVRRDWGVEVDLAVLEALIADALHRRRQTI